MQIIDAYKITLSALIQLVQEKTSTAGNRVEDPDIPLHLCDVAGPRRWYRIVAVPAMEVKKG